jgi:hypothetical protein
MTAYDESHQFSAPGRNRRQRTSPLRTLNLTVGLRASEPTDQLSSLDPEETFSVSSSLLQGGHPGSVSMTAMYRPMSVSPASQARDNGDQTQQSAEERRISLRHNPRRALCRFAATTAHGTVMNQQKNIPTRTAASSPPPNIGASAMASACATNETTISPATPLRNEM